MKKILATLLSVMLIFSATCVTAESNDLFVQITETLSAYTPKERADYISFFRPFFTTDTGVSAAIFNLDSGTMDGQLTSLFGDNIDKNTIKRVFLTFSCIPESSNIRMKYADIFQKREEIGLAGTTKKGVEALMQVMYTAAPKLEKMFADDGITPGVIANMLKAVNEINDGKKLILYTTDGFETNKVNKTFQESFDSVWKGYVNASGGTVTFDGLCNKFVSALNQTVPDGDKKNVALALDNLGICDYQVKTTGGTGGTGGNSNNGNNGGDTDVTSKPENESFKVEVNGAQTDIAVGENGGGIHTVSTAYDAPVLYLVENGTLVPQVFVLTENGNVTAEFLNNQMYVIKNAVFPFADANGWGKSYIRTLYNLGVVNGKSDMIFAPDDAITREEFVKLIVSVFDLKGTNSAPFNDVYANAWYAPYVAAAYENGVVNGMSENTFGVGEKIRRQDMAKIICGVLDKNGLDLPKADISVFADCEDIADYAKDSVGAVYGLKIVSGDDNGCFRPNGFATRQEAAKMIFGMIDVYTRSVLK